MIGLQEGSSVARILAVGVTDQILLATILLATIDHALQSGLMINCADFYSCWAIAPLATPFRVWYDSYLFHF